MAVTAVRTLHTPLPNTIKQFGNLTFTGTYTTGGVLLNPTTILGGPGSTPIAPSSVVDFRVISPLGYNYVLIGQGATAKLKILNGITELANSAAYPESPVAFIMEGKK